jgi:serine/threonine protein kinase
MQVVVGRDTGLSFSLSDQMCSRRHCGIGEIKNQWLIKDLKSVNGTLVNGHSIAPGQAIKLELGSSVNVGDTLISFLPSSTDGEEDPLIGVNLGGYRIDRRIGRGAMGVVYRAHQMSLGRDVALKILSGDLAHDEKFAGMFVKEARAAAALNHPNILQVYDVATADGQLYIAMEFAASGSVLDELRTRGTIELDRSLSIIEDTLRALVYAEKKGLVHRDIKPDNLMITGDGQVKLGDLGLAASTAELAQVQTGVFGTPHYIAPEQAQGKPVDHRADLYALGASWYRMLTGNTLFQGASVRDILKAQVRDAHVPLRQVLPDAPAAVSAIMDRMLAKEPAERYQSATEVLHDIASFKTNRHSSAAAIAASPVISRPMVVGKRKTPWAAIIIGVLVVGGAVAGAIWGFSTFFRPAVNPGPKTPPPPEPTKTESAPPEQPGKQSIPAAATLLGMADGYERVGDITQALLRYNQIIESYPNSLEAVTAAERRKAIEATLKLRKDAASAKRKEWETLLAKLRAEELAQYKIEAAIKAVADFRATVDAKANPDLAPLVAELAEEALVDTMKSEVGTAFIGRLDEFAKQVTRALVNPEPEARVALMDSVLKETAVIRDLTDSTLLAGEAASRIAEWTKQRDAAQKNINDGQRATRESALASVRPGFNAMCQTIAQHCARREFDKARDVQSAFRTGCKEIDAYGATEEFAGIMLDFSDRAHQTDIEEAALRFVAANWASDGFQDISGNPRLSALFGGAAELALVATKVEPGVDPATLPLAFEFQSKAKGAKDAVAGKKNWADLAAADLAALITWAVGLKGEKSLSTALAVADPHHRLGLGALLLESGEAAAAFGFVSDTYEAAKKLTDKENPSLKRRSREYMAAALMLLSRADAAAGNAAQARKLYDRAMSDEFKGTRVRG